MENKTLKKLDIPNGQDNYGVDDDEDQIENK